MAGKLPVVYGSVYGFVLVRLGRQAVLQLIWWGSHTEIQRLETRVAYLLQTDEVKYPPVFCTIQEDTYFNHVTSANKGAI